MIQNGSNYRCDVCTHNAFCHCNTRRSCVVDLHTAVVIAQTERCSEVRSYIDVALMIYTIVESRCVEETRNITHVHSDRHSPSLLYSSLCRDHCGSTSLFFRHSACNHLLSHTVSHSVEHSVVGIVAYHVRKHAIHVAVEIDIGISLKPLV